MKTAEEIEQECYGISPQERVEILSRWQLNTRISALEEAADAAISDALFHTHDAEGLCICGNCSARRAILSLATKLKEGTGVMPPVSLKPPAD